MSVNQMNRTLELGAGVYIKYSPTRYVFTKYEGLKKKGSILILLTSTLLNLINQQIDPKKINAGVISDTLLNKICTFSGPEMALPHKVFLQFGTISDMRRVLKKSLK